jgi:hypothetical protein
MSPIWGVASLLAIQVWSQGKSPSDGPIFFLLMRLSTNHGSRKGSSRKDTGSREAIR